MRIALTIALIIGLAGMAIGQVKSNKFTKDLNLHEDYYKPYRNVIPLSYFYAELGFSHTRAMNHLMGISGNSTITPRNRYKGKTFRLGITRPFNINTTEFDKNYGFRGKRNKFYGQFNFGWFFHSGYMSQLSLIRDVSASNENNYLIDLGYNGFEIGMGFVQNMGNRLALEGNFNWIPFVFGTKENSTRILVLEPYGRQAYTWNLGIRLQHFSLNFNWTDVSFKALTRSTASYIQSNIDAPRRRYSSFNTGIKYTYKIR